jgi:uncharacterized protein (DUF58 family)
MVMSRLSSTLKPKLVLFFNTKFNHWIGKRIPAATHQLLSNRNVFIFPTRFGFAYLFFVLMLFLLATNYQNNLIMLLSYLLASLFVSAMMHSFFNLSGLKLETSSEVRGFANSNLYLPIKLTSSKARFSLKFVFAQQKPITLTSFNVEQHENATVEVLVPFYASQRGVFMPSRVKVVSEYALGLFSCWTHLDFACQFVVYPTPKTVKLALNRNNSDKASIQGVSVSNNGDDFYQLKNYVVGESLTQVAWKHLAKGQGWLSKSYQQNQTQALWLNIVDMPSAKIEKRLSYLCYLVQEYHQAGQAFGLDLSLKPSLELSSQQAHIKIIPNEGKAHLKQCLMALAQFKLASKALQ